MNKKNLTKKFTGNKIFVTIHSLSKEDIERLKKRIIVSEVYNPEDWIAYDTPSEKKY